jgi:hypothetical protein
MTRQHKQQLRMAAEAAGLIRGGGDPQRARFRAARRVAGGWVPEDELPSSTQISRELARGGTDPAGGLAGLLGDRFEQLADLLRPLAQVPIDPASGASDLLEHLLQVFEMVRQRQPYDEELLTAALVHDLGRAIDRANPAASTVAAVAHLVTDRTCLLVASLPTAREYRAGTLGQRARKRLESADDFESLQLLAEADHRSGDVGRPVELDAAIAILRTLEAECDETGRLPQA